ncbi:unnamed protein product, partial [marine sediment metagenome]
MSKTVLISVFDKRGVVELANFLDSAGWRILSSGGTFKKLTNECLNLNIQEISDYTGVEEMLGGRVKTLHPFIHGGILADRSKETHMDELKKLGIGSIDMVIVNLYPFEKVIQKDDVTMEEAVENIDIGGHTLIRAAAKNFKDVTVVVNPSDYKSLVNSLVYDSLNLDMRRKFASKAFSHIMRYDYFIANYFGSEDENFLIKGWKKEYNLKYGCNPQQNCAAIYR